MHAGGYEYYEEGANAATWPEEQPDFSFWDCCYLILCSFWATTELVGNSPSQKNWRGILIALLVIAIVLSLIVTAVILVSPKNVDKDIGELFTFEEMFSKEFQPNEFTAEWLGGNNQFVYLSRETEVMIYDCDKNSTTSLMRNETFRQHNTEKYWVSEDRDYVLIAKDIQKVYRHSELAKYIIYRVNPAPGEDRIVQFPSWADNRVHMPLQFAGWSPKGHALTFVLENNLYYQDSPDTTPYKVTNDGQHRVIFNGIPDWVYEEEILHSNVAHWWSKDGTYILYARFDDTNVPTYRFPNYGPGEAIYGYVDEIAYPKAGDRRENINPQFSLHIMTSRLRGMSRKQIHPPSEMQGRDHYVTFVKWQDDRYVLIAWSNRAQNETVLTICDAVSTDCHVNLVEKSRGGWVNLKAPMFIEEGEKYLIILPEKDGDHGYWQHIALITTPKGRLGTRIYLTHGTWDVTEVVAYDEDQKLVYFISTNRDPRQRHLFRVGIRETSDHRMKTPQCLTCEYPDDCQYVTASFSQSGQYYILHCKGPGIPSYTLKSTFDDRHILMEDNSLLKVRLEKKGIPQKYYYEIETEKGYKIWAQVHLPPILNPDHLTKYPMLVHTYGGPGTQQVTEQFHIGFETYLTNAENVIYVSVDGRGSGGRGDRFMHEVYRNLGTVEVRDQIIAAEYLRDTLQFVDPDRIAIWGWSYGGFVTAHVIGDDSQDAFSCGVAVAPVTDWRYYDTVYTERYMGLDRPDDNYAGYTSANVSSKARSFNGRNFMVVHGTADDNVHFQHTAQLVKSLTQADVDFRVQIYTDKNHAISGPDTSRHLYRTITRFLQNECWDGGKPRLPSPEEKQASKKA